MLFRSFLYWSDIDSGESAIGVIRIYRNDGDNLQQNFASAVPSTLLYQSDPIAIANGLNSVLLDDILLLVPDKVTWTLEVTPADSDSDGVNDDLNAGVVFSKDPSSGSSMDDFWVGTNGSWKLNRSPGVTSPSKNNFRAKVFAYDSTSLSFVYTPDTGFNGTDSIAYSVDDGNKGTSSATLSITVGTDNTPPKVESFKLSQSTLLAGESATVTVVFSEPVSSFSSSDITKTQTVTGEDGSDDIFFVNGTEEVKAGGGDDVVMIRDSVATTIYGEAGDDKLYGNAAGNIVDGGSGADTVSGGGGDDTLSGGDGADTMNGGSGVDTMSGGAGADVIGGGSGADVISGGSGVDTISGGAGVDTITGGEGNDVIDGGAGNDVALYAGNMADFKLDIGAIGVDKVSDLNVGDGDEGVDTLTRVKTVRFADGELSVSYDTDGEVRVNTYPFHDQSEPSMASLAGGNYVVTWQDSSGHDGGSSWDVRGQVYSAGGVAVGKEFRVNSYVSSSQQRPSVAALAGGGFVVTWDDSSAHDGGSGWDVRGQRYDASGVAVGSEFMVNTHTTGSQYYPSVAPLVGGGFIVAWRDDSAHDGGSGYDVWGQRYDANGAAAGSEFRVNKDQKSGNQYEPSVASLTSGGFVVAWRDDSGGSHDGGNGYDVWARVFDADGTQAVAEFRVNKDQKSGNQYQPSVTGLAGGKFVVTWRDDSGSSHDDGSGVGSGYDVWGRVYDGDGTGITSEFRVNTYTSSSQYEPSVSSLAGGGFVVTWRDDSGHDGGSGSDIRGQRYDAAGARVGSAFRVNTYTSGTQYQPSVSDLVGGAFVVGWSSQYQDGSSYGVYNQRFDANGASISTVRLTGNTGDDKVSFVDAQSEMIVDLGGGNDTLTLGNGEDNIRVESVENVLLGGGNDIVTVEGDDAVSLAGGAGDDTYTVNVSGTVVVEAAGEGSDTVISRASSYTLGDNVETLRLAEGGLSGTGNAGDNQIIGSEGNDTLAGGGGNDTLSGGAGEDVAKFGGKMLGYQIDLVNKTVTDTDTSDGDDGTDTFSGIEKLSFGDGGEIGVSSAGEGEFRVNSWVAAEQQLPSVAGTLRTRALCSRNGKITEIPVSKQSTPENLRKSCYYYLHICLMSNV